MDLAGWDFSKDGPVTLSGQWTFYESRLRADLESSSDAGQPIEVPGLWENDAASTEALAPSGYGLYELNITLPKDIGPLFVYMPAPRGAFRLWETDVLLLEQHRVGLGEATSHPVLHSRIIGLGEHATDLRLWIELSSFHYHTGGLEAAPQLGTLAQLRARQTARLAVDLVLTVGFLLGAIYHLALYSWRRSDVSSLLFGVMCLLLSVFSAFTGEGLIHDLPGLEALHAATAYQILYLAIFSVGPLFVHFILKLSPIRGDRWVILQAYLVSVVFVVVTVFTPPTFFTATLTAYRVIVLVWCAFLLAAAYRAVRVRRAGARTLLVCLSLLVLALAYELLTPLSGGTDLSRPALFVLTGVLALNLVYRFTHSFGSLESLSRKLDRRVDIHGDLAGLHGELDAARRFQQSLIPDRPPDVAGLHIAAHYRAMQIVGGDFYDFRTDGKALGILMADVSGHGIPAALIVSMLKLAFWQEKDRTPRPGTLFPSMNRLLLGNTSGEFVTASYACIEPAAMRVTTTNAGHPPVFVWKKASKQLLELRPVGRLLGVFEEPKFEEAELALDVGDRIVLYTDGLFESPGKKTGEQFGMTRFRAFLADYDHLPVDRFVDRLLNTVVRWSGGEDRIPDDIALIAIDVEGLGDPTDLSRRVTRLGYEASSRVRNTAGRTWKRVGSLFRRKGK